MQWCFAKYCYHYFFTLHIRHTYSAVHPFASYSHHTHTHTHGNIILEKPLVFMHCVASRFGYPKYRLSELSLVPIGSDNRHSTVCVCIYIMFVTCFRYACHLTDDVSPTPRSKQSITLPPPVLHSCRQSSARLQFTFSSAFANLRKENISFAMYLSVCLSVRMEQLGSHWTDFHEIWYSRIFRKSVEKIKIWQE